MGSEQSGPPYEAPPLLSTDELIATFKRVMKADLNTKLLTIPHELDGMYQNLKELDNLDQHLKVTIDLWRDQASRLWSCMGGYNVDPTLSPTKQLVDDHMSSLFSMQDQLRAIHQSTREGANKHSRPYLKSLGLMDLPDEILVTICSFLHPNPYRSKECYTRPSGVFKTNCRSETERNLLKNIQNLRLTCKRLCDASSILLLPILTVGIDPDSLLRFSNVSRHPIISTACASMQDIIVLY